MILFKEDWDKYPSAIVDVKTSNRSFLKYSALLKSMGVANHLFPLALHNPELQGVDPFDPNISMEQMCMVAIEAKQNPWYAFREIMRAPGRGSPEPTPFQANRGNMAVFWLYFNHVTPMLIQIRQTGKSFSVDSLLTYLMNILCSNSWFSILTKDDTTRAFNSERIRDIQSELPFYLNQRSKNDIANTEEIKVKSLDNSLRLLVGNKSPKAALNIGRGLSVGTQVIDEAGFVANVDITLPSALAAGTAVRDIARKNGNPYGTIMMTTGVKKNSQEGKFIYDLLQRSAIWTEKFFDSQNMEALMLMVKRHSPSGELRVNCTFSHIQLGYSNAWLKQAIQDSMVSGEDADRDFFNKHTSGSMTSPLSIEVMKTIRESQVDNYFTEVTVPHGYIVRWFIPETAIDYRMKTGYFIMGADTSDAVGADDIFLVIRDVMTGEVVAAGNYNETNLITFAEWLLTWFIKYENLILNMERRSTGGMIMDYLIRMMLAHGIDPFKRIYNKVVSESDEYPDRFKEIDRELYMRDQDVYVKYKKTFGFATSATGTNSRSELYSTTLVNSARYTGDTVRDPMLIEQVLSLTTKNGRVDHAAGAHDDACIAWLLSGWFLFNAKNLGFYGINSRDVLANNGNRKKEVGSSVDQYDAYIQKSLREEVEVLTEALKGERDVFLSQRIEHRLQFTISKLKITDEEKISLDDLIRQLKEQKQQSARNAYGGFRSTRY